MRCKACDRILDDYELSQYDKVTKIPLDMCISCLYVSDKTLSDIEAVVDTTIDREYNDMDEVFEKYDENLM
jgi:uncharacterized Fe-S center protein